MNATRKYSEEARWVRFTGGRKETLVLAEGMVLRRLQDASEGGGWEPDSWGIYARLATSPAAWWDRPTAIRWRQVQHLYEVLVAQGFRLVRPGRRPLVAPDLEVCGV